MKNISVKQDEKEPVPVEVLATSIREISASMKRLRRGPLGENALLLLIHQNTKATGPKYRAKTKPTIKEIKSVLDSIESLEKTYIR